YSTSPVLWWSACLLDWLCPVRPLFLASRRQLRGGSFFSSRRSFGLFAFVVFSRAQTRVLGERLGFLDWLRRAGALLLAAAILLGWGAHTKKLWARDNFAFVLLMHKQTLAVGQSLAFFAWLRRAGVLT